MFIIWLFKVRTEYYLASVIFHFKNKQLCKCNVKFTNPRSEICLIRHLILVSDLTYLHVFMQLRPITNHDQSKRYASLIQRTMEPAFRKSWSSANSIFVLEPEILGQTFLISNEIELCFLFVYIIIFLIVRWDSFFFLSPTLLG